MEGKPKSLTKTIFIWFFVIILSLAAIYGIYRLAIPVVDIFTTPGPKEISREEGPPPEGALAEITEITITQLGYAFIALMGILVIMMPYRFATVPIILTCCYITIGQVIMIGPFHFTVLRIVVGVGWIRLILRREFSSIGLNVVDKMLLVWVVTGSFINVFLLHGASEAAMVNRLGVLYDVLGIYFFFRFYIKSFEDFERVLKIIVVSVAPLALIMIFEGITGRNIFSFFGGVPEYSWVREGEVRSQGPFRNAIIAGTFGATLLPLVFSLWWQERGRVFAIIGILASTTMTVTARSGGPISAYFFGVLTLVFFKFQNRIRTVLWLVVFAMIFAQLFMQTPIWYLMSRLSEVVGGGGWHRAYLIDQAIAHFDEWWLFGSDYTAHWMPYALAIEPNHSDITNQYLVEGIRGGLLTMILFTALVVLCFRKMYNVYMASEEQPVEKRMLLWCISASLVTHAVTFTSVSYFDQMITFWYMLLAIISWVGSLSYEPEEEETAEFAHST